MVSKGKARTAAVEAPVLPSQENPLWENNEIQFARLLEEVAANVDITGDEVVSMQQSMDLSDEDFNELWDRAHRVWEAAKEASRGLQ